MATIPIDWNVSPTLDNSKRIGPKKIPSGFTKYHAKLMDICLGTFVPSVDAVVLLADDGSNSSTILARADLEKLAYMVLVEFAASVRQQRAGVVEETQQAKAYPHPYDVYTMKTALGSQSSNVSVLIPTQGGKLVWWDGIDTFASPTDDLHVYRIASLSGSARVLVCLYRALEEPTALSESAMKRELIVTAVRAAEELNRNSGLSSSFSSTAPSDGAVASNLEVSQSMQQQSKIAAITKSTEGLLGRFSFFNVSMTTTGSPSPTNVAASSDAVDEHNDEMKKAVTSTAAARYGVVDSILLDTLNESQQRAVITAASARFQEGFFPIQGPPGCGKTTTMVSMIAAIQNGRKIVAAPSNAAVANLGLKLIQKGLFTFPHVCVFGDGCDESVQFLNPRRRSEYFTRTLRRYDECRHQSVDETAANFTALTEKRDRNMDNIRRETARWLHVDEELSMQELSLLCPSISVDATNSITREGKKMVDRIMAHANVVLCTLNSAGSPILQNAVSGCNFQTLLLDEGGQCTEAEFFIATTFPGIKRIIVMGDPKQLRPTVLEPACVQAGFGRSWLSHVYALHPAKVHLLDTQYRMDPVLLTFPNKRFYGNRIQSGENVQLRAPAIANPFLFLDTQRKGREEKDENLSYRNAYEAAVIYDLFKKDTDIATIRRANPNARTILITPYKGQARLLRQVLKSENIEVSTVDAFQGQEAEIVFLSTVRTRQVGFVDDGERLNVALTRAKRILRVVGDSEFFMRLRPGSTLRALVLYSEKHGILKKTTLRLIPSCPPDLSVPTKWKITLTQRFHNTLALLPTSSKNIALNTLFALALPDLSACGSHVTEKDGWHGSWLKCYGMVRVVWVARDHGGVCVIEAHHAGSSDSCLVFRQKNHVPPDGCRSPRSDMSGLVPDDVPPAPTNGRLFASWALDERLKDAILSGQLVDLPLSKIQLDPLQEKVARSPPPLLIESRSGTGKTLVLLQHAAFYDRLSDLRPALFVTVSPRLKNELETKYEELTPIHGVGLPKTKFYAFRGFVQSLLTHLHVTDYDDQTICTFRGYTNSRRSHESIKVEASLVENEIGGVIMGSLIAAVQTKPLNRNQYLSDKRSNIPNTNDESLRQRELVFDEFMRYKNWKMCEKKYDIHDVVLRILIEKPQQIFSSAYLDEVQDLSHAAIFLICSIAGRDRQYWVCGGDPAQMISPGCSFTFDGLKQTLLKLEGGIEKKIKQVEHLLVNYRTTKDILALGNAILTKARHYYPGAIDFAKPETARKDLGLKVVVCNWKAALRTQTKFGENQAFIYSTSCAIEIVVEANTWLNGHPFVLSSLESKGLEFDDVVVAFDQDRKAWQLEHRREDSLSMLRELYVAVTRAQKRVVVLLKEEIPAIAAFFRSLECDLEVSDGRVFDEFNCDTSTEEWFVRAQALFNNEQFKFAASCFTRAERQDWAFLAKGQELLISGLQLEGTKEIRKAARVFFEVQDHEQILDILKSLLDFKTSEWDTSDDHIFLATLQKCPNALSTVQSIQYAIHRKDFSSVRVDALMDQDVCKLLVHHRQADWLVQLVAESSEEDREFIGKSMPLVIIDYHCARSQHFEACIVALKAREFKLADSITIALLNETKKKSSFDPEAVIRVAVLWANVESIRVLPASSTSLLLYKLLHTPKSLSSMQKEECLRLLGKDIILLAYRCNNLAVEFLLGFSTVMFKSEVDSCLMRQHRTCPFDVAKWYDRHGFPALSAQFIHDRLKQWNNCDLLRASLLLYIRPQWLFQEFKVRTLSGAAMMLNILSPTLSKSSKEQFWRGYVVHGEPPSHLAEKEFADLDLKYHAIGLTNFFHLLERQGHCIEAIFLQVYLHCCDTSAAARRSLEALKTRQLVHQNISELLRIWAEGSAMKRSLFPGVQMKSYKDIYGLLMCIYFNVAPTPDLCQVFAAAADTVTPMLMAFGPAAFAYCQMNPFESPHHNEGLFQSLVAFHAELASRCSSTIKKVESAAPGPLSDSRSAEATNAKPMSKKEARKQKQSLAKLRTENKPATGGGGGGKKKRNNNKKKKGGRK